MDYTPFLDRLRNAAGSQIVELPEEWRMVICCRSRALLCAVVATSSRPDQIVAAATTETEGLELVEQHQPDLLCVTDQLEEGCGARLVTTVKRSGAATRTLLLVTRASKQQALRTAIQARCDAVLLESRMGLGNFQNALRSLRDGGLYLDQALGTLLSNREDCDGQLLEPLSPRELQVLERLVQGDSNADIARRLIVSIDTVKTHVRNLLLKLRARDRTHAAVIGISLGLVDWPEPGSDR
ncbi:MAG: DNA-binding response regulator [Cyanobacteriota bacterium]